ncbi:MAG: hypothetical protein ABH830_01045, partial [Patescibacteria group bacterium]
LVFIISQTIFFIFVNIYYNPALAGVPNLTMPDLQIDIGGLKDKLSKSTPIECGKDESGNKIYCINWIGEYIAGIYKYAVGIVGILAAIVLMYGGVLWIVAGGSAERTGSAKAWIGASLTGLVIAVTSYTILYQINPELTKFNALEITSTNKEQKIPPGFNIQKNADGSYSTTIETPGLPDFGSFLSPDSPLFAALKSIPNLAAKIMASPGLMEGLADIPGLANKIATSPGLLNALANMPDLADNIGASTKFMEGLSNISGLAKKIGASSGLLRGLSLDPNLIQNIGASTEFMENLGSLSNLAGNIGASMDFTRALGKIPDLAKNLGAAPEFTKGLSDFPDLAKNLGAAPEFMDGLGSTRSLAENLGSSPDLMDGLALDPNLAKNFGAAPEFMGGLGSVSGLAEKIGQSSGLTQGLSDFPDLAKNIGNSPELMEGLGNIPNLANNIGASPDLTQALGSIPGLADNIGISSDLTNSLGSLPGLANYIGQNSSVLNGFNLGGFNETLGDLAKSIDNLKNKTDGEKGKKLDEALPLIESLAENAFWDCLDACYPQAAIINPDGSCKCEPPEIKSANSCEGSCITDDNKPGIKYDIGDEICACIEAPKPQPLKICTVSIIVKESGTENIVGQFNNTAPKASQSDCDDYFDASLSNVLSRYPDSNIFTNHTFY